LHQSFPYDYTIKNLLAASFIPAPNAAEQTFESLGKGIKGAILVL
jgi:hypothetical protein